MVDEVLVECPACGETCALGVDTTAGATQSYVEDCAVCCRAMQVSLRCRPGEVLSISVSAE